MNGSRLCPKCGAEMHAGAPQGICPRCLMGIGLDATTVPPADPADANRPPPAAGRFTAPSSADLASRFPQLEILELLGQGGMGAVYKARQPALDRLVAVKILPPEVASDPGFTERFTREARALAKLNHPNIVAVHDFGQADGQFYLVMEFVDGLNLRQLLASGALEPPQALAIVPQICEALQFAHDGGLVHRDIKPENILLDKHGRVKIADFGLAKLLGKTRADLTLTAPGYVMGTPHYMAPEQLERPLEVDHRADIYSLGVVFYEMLTRELPLGRFAPPSHKVEVDVRLDEVVLKALERERDRRYQHASEVKTAMATLSMSKGTAAAPAFERPRGVPLRVRSGVVALFAVCWIVTAAMWSFGWAGLSVALVATFVTIFVSARWIVAHVPPLERELRARGRARKAWYTAAAVVLFSSGWAGVLLSHLVVADARDQSEARERLAVVLEPQYRGKADLVESLALECDLPSESDLMVWPRGGATLRMGATESRNGIALGLMCALMMFAVALLFDTPKYRSTWAYYWKPHLTLSIAIFGSLLSIHLVLFMAPIHGSGSPRHWQAVIYERPLDDVRRAVDKFSLEEGYVVGNHLNAAVRHVEKDVDLAGIWSVELVPESPFERFRVTWAGVRRPRPRVLVECVSLDLEPTRTRVQVSTGAYRIPSTEDEDWRPVIERLLAALAREGAE